MHRARDPSLPPTTLVIGGVRSGKSVHAERLITETHLGGIYVATAEIRDGEMAERVRLHRERRGPSWDVIEEPLDIVGALRAGAGRGMPFLIDSLTVWLANVLERDRDPGAEVSGLVSFLGSFDGPVVMVADEVGLGGISANALQRRFADAAGQMNQAIAMAADRVVLVAAGLPLTLKDVAN